MIFESKHPEFIATLPEGWSEGQPSHVWGKFVVAFSNESAELVISKPPDKETGLEMMNVTRSILDAVQICENDFRSRTLINKSYKTSHHIDVRTGRQNHTSNMNLLLNDFINFDKIGTTNYPGLKYTFTTRRQMPHLDSNLLNNSGEMLYSAASESGTLTWEQRFLLPSFADRIHPGFLQFLLNEQASARKIRQTPDNIMIAGLTGSVVHAAPRLPRSTNRVFFRDHVKVKTNK